MSLANLQMEHSLRRKKTDSSRNAPRFDAPAMLALKCISLAEGHKVKLINISRRGALIESRDRMSPGSTISLRLTTEKTVYFIKGRIVRSSSSPMSGRVFRSGIAFHEDFTILPEGADERPEPNMEAVVQTVA